MRATSTAVILVAAGRSNRMGRSGDKVWKAVAGRPILFYSILAFLKAGLRDLVVVVRPGQRGLATRRLKAVTSRARLTVVEGGKERQDSVWNGATASAAEFVLVHDVARPAVSVRVIRAVWEGSVRHGACIPVVPANDTLKRISRNRVVSTVDREGIFCVQTPQGFRRSILLEALTTARTRGWRGTDCAGLVEKLGRPVIAVVGDQTNLKVTRPEDLRIFERLL